MNSIRLHKKAKAGTAKIPTKGNYVNVLSFLASAVLPGLLAIYATSLYSRYFTPAEYGRYSLALAVTAPVLALASQWLAQSIVRFYHELAAKSEERNIGQVVSVANLFVFSVVAAIVLVLVLSNIVSKENIPYYLSGFAYLLTSIILTNVSSYMVYSGRHHIYNLVMTLSSCASFLFTIFFMHFTKLGISSLLFGISLSNLIAIVTFYSVTKISVFTAKSSDKSKNLLRQFLNYGIPLSFWMVMYTVINISDRYVLQYFLDSGEVGRYSIHYSLVSLPFLVINSPIINVYSPKIMKAAAENDYLRVRMYIKDASNVYVIIGLLAMSLAYRFGDSVPYIIIDRNYYVDKAFYLPIIAGFCIWNMAMFWHKPMEIAKNTRTMLFYICIAAGVNIILNIAFVPRYGINASAIATLISFCAYSMLVFIANRKNSGLIIDTKQILLCVFASIVALATSNSILISSINTTHIFGAISSILIFSLEYLLLCFVVSRVYTVANNKIRREKGKKYA